MDKGALAVFAAASGGVPGGERSTEGDEKEIILTSIARAPDNVFGMESAGACGRDDGVNVRAGLSIVKKDGEKICGVVGERAVCVVPAEAENGPPDTDSGWGERMGVDNGTIDVGEVAGSAAAGADRSARAISVVIFCVTMLAASCTRASVAGITGSVAA